MEMFTILLGLFMLYTMIHFVIIQHNKTWKKRTNYEKFVTGFAIFSITMIVFSL